MSEDDGGLPSPAEVLNSVDGLESTGGAEAYFEHSFEAASLDAEFDYAHLKGLTSHYHHKGCWSYFLMFCIGSMIIFQSVLLWLVGLNRMDFSQYTWLLPALLVQNLTQIVGLAAFAVRSLFDKRSRKDDRLTVGRTND